MPHLATDPAPVTALRCRAHGCRVMLNGATTAATKRAYRTHVRSAHRGWGLGGNLADRMFEAASRRIAVRLAVTDALSSLTGQPVTATVAKTICRDLLVREIQTIPDANPNPATAYPQVREHARRVVASHLPGFAADADTLAAAFAAHHIHLGASIGWAFANEPSLISHQSVAFIYDPDSQQTVELERGRPNRLAGTSLTVEMVGDTLTGSFDDRTLG